MTAHSILQCARDLGIRLSVEGDRLVVEADTEPPAEILDAIAAVKAEIIRQLTPEHSGVWTAEDWRFMYDERAGVAQYDQRITRVDAEALAFECCVVEWLDRNRVASTAGHCLWCGHPGGPGRILLRFGTVAKSRVWLHDECRSRWPKHRRKQAVEALAAMGIHASATAAGSAAR